MKKIIMNFILRDVRYYFGFLLKRGYEIDNAIYEPEKLGNWMVDFKSSSCYIRIYSDRTVLNLMFIPLNKDINNGISIRAMIYFLTDGQEFIGDLPGKYTSWKKSEQYERLASLVKTYIDRIEPYFGTNYEKYRNDLFSAQKKYNDYLTIERHKRKVD